MDLYEKSMELREDILNIVYHAKAGHIGGDLSVVDLLIALYYDQMRTDPALADDPDRDRFVLSKGHSVEALYAVLADKGFFPKEELKTYFAFGSRLIGHPNNKVNGIEMNSGALGHGLSVSVGMAIAGKMDKRDYRVYTVLGDGELAEGSVWEAIMCANQYKLDNLCALVDKNGLQISGTTDQVMSHEVLRDRFFAFNWNVLEVDGHNFEQLHQALETTKWLKGKPTAIIAHTIKGKGISFMENNYKWHHKVPSETEYEQALAELRMRKASAS